MRKQIKIENSTERQEQLCEMATTITELEIMAGTPIDFRLLPDDRIDARRLREVTARLQDVAK